MRRLLGNWTGESGGSCGACLSRDPGDGKPTRSPCRIFAAALLTAHAVAVSAGEPRWQTYGASSATGALTGRACGGEDAAGLRLYRSDSSPTSELALRLPGGVWARAGSDGPGVREVTLHARPVGTLEAADGGWRIALSGGDAECAFEGVRVRIDASAARGAEDDAVVRTSLAWEQRLGEALEARAGGNPQAARAAVSARAADDRAGDASLQARIERHRARLALEIGDVDRAAVELGAATQHPARDATTTRDADAFRRLLELRIVAARGDYAAAVRGREAWARDYREAAVSAEDRLANAVYLGAARIAQHDVPGAAVALDDAWPVAMASLRPTDPLRVDAVIARALVDRQQGDYRASEQRVAQALRAVAESRGTDNFAYAQLAWRYALNATVAKHPLDAIPALLRAVAWFDAALGASNRFTLDARETLAYVFAHADRVSEAVALQRDVVAAYPRSFNATPQGRITVAHILANYLGRGRRFGDAQALLTALIADANGAGVRPDRILHLELDLAYVRWQQRDADGACRVVAQALAQRDGGVNLPADLASELDLLVGVCAARGDPVDGAARLQAVVLQRRALFGDDNFAVLAAQCALARAQIAAGNEAAARATLDDVAATLETLRAVESPDAAGARNAFAEWLQSDAMFAGYRDLAYLHARAGDAPNAIQVAEAARARSLGDAIGVTQDMAALSTLDHARAAALLARVRELDAEIALLPTTDAARPGLEVARIDAASALDALRTRTPAPGAAVVTPRLDLAAAQAQLPPGTAFVGLQVVHDGVWAYVVRRDSAPTVVLLDAAVPLIGAAAPLYAALSQPRESLAPIWRTADGAYVNALTPPTADARRVPRAALTDALGDALLGPLLPALRGTTTLIVAAEGPLAALPFDALTHDGVPVGRRFAIRRAPSLAVLASRAGTKPQVKRFTHDLVAIGAPDYAAMQPAAAGPLAARAWGALPGAADEVASVAALFAPSRRRVVAGADATKPAFVGLARDGTFARARYVHVAAHGVLAADAPQWSSIVLADGRARDGVDGATMPGYVTAAEIATYALGADLVVLSACETALGREVAGEGVFGLPYALAVAGARETLLTLWPVADAPTAAFMRRFYAKLAKGATPARALAQTKRETMSSPAYAAPFYWAGFVLYGT